MAPISRTFARLLLSTLALAPLAADAGEIPLSDWTSRSSSQTTSCRSHAIQ